MFKKKPLIVSINDKSIVSDIGVEVIDNRTPDAAKALAIINEGKPKDANEDLEKISGQVKALNKHLSEYGVKSISRNGSKLMVDTYSGMVTLCEGDWLIVPLE